MKTDSTFPDSKVERKVAAAAGDETARYKKTEFGWRRVGKLPKLAWLVGFPFMFIYRRLRGSKDA